MFKTLFSPFKSLLSKNQSRTIKENHFRNQEEEVLFKLIKGMSIKKGLQEIPQITLSPSNSEEPSFSTLCSPSYSIIILPSSALESITEESKRFIQGKKLIPKDINNTLYSIQSAINTIAAVRTNLVSIKSLHYPGRDLRQNFQRRIKGSPLLTQTKQVSKVTDNGSEIRMLRGDSKEEKNFYQLLTTSARKANLDILPEMGFVEWDADMISLEVFSCSQEKPKVILSSNILNHDREFALSVIQIAIENIRHCPTDSDSFSLFFCESSNSHI